MIRRVTSVIAEGAEEPIDSAMMVAWLRLPAGNPQVALLDDIIEEVRDLFERITGRTIVQKTHTMYIDTIPGGVLPWWSGVREGARTAEQGNSIDLDLPPAIDITSVSTFDIDNTEQTWDPENYYLDNTDPDQIPRLCLNLGAVWPVNLRARDALKIVFTAGYGEDFPLPPSMRGAFKKMVAHVFANPGDCSENGACSCGAMDDLRPFVLVDNMPRPEDGRARGLHSSYDGAFSDA